jgi:bifunctional DNase/RNase
MKKIELEIVALSHSITQTHSYAVVLGEVNGLRRLPIVIGGFEAQAIAVALERMQPSRPLTHDLFANFMSTFGIDLSEVIIYKLEEGIFFAKLICQGADGENVEIDSRTSDALALAVRANCRIYTYENILEAAGLYLDQPEGEQTEATEGGTAPSPATRTVTTDKDLKNLSLDELNTLLQQVLEQEDYVRAISIRDEINTRKSK